MSAVVAAATRQLGRFELLREIRRGAQATVWLARDPRLQREVALKLLDPEAEALDEWLHEARAVSCLSHPNIVPVFEADDAGGQPYLVFEFVEGPTLAQARRQRGAWPAREAVRLMLGVLDALAAAHAQGIVHRDLKPSNVLLGRDGRARVMDFGIAVRLQPAARGGAAAFRVDTAETQGADLFGALCARGADTLIADTRGAAVAARLPAWYRGKLQAASFLLLPMMLKRKPIGLIYADRQDGGAIVLTEPEMQLVRQLRDEAVAAFSRPAP